MDRVLVLDGNQRSALAATRSLGSKNLSVITGDCTSTSLAGSSKYATAHATYPSPHTDTPAFIAGLEALVRSHGIEVMLPMTDVTAGLVLRHRGHFPGVRIPFSDLDAYDRLTDKLQLSALAASLGVRSPTTVHITEDGAPPDTQELRYPAVIKPVRSKSWSGNQWIGVPVQYVDSFEGLRAAVARTRKLAAVPLLAQEYIPGHGQGIFCLYDRGRPHSFFSHRRLREKPPSGGVSVLSESVGVDDEMRCMAERLLTHVGWHGVAMVEFKVRPDGTPFLIEVNGRFWGSLQLAIDAGIDFPYLLYRIAKGEPTEPVNSFRVGARLRWLLGDLDHLYLTLKASGTNGRWRHKIRALRDFLVLSQPQLRYETNRLDDMGPFWFELRRYFGDIASAD